MTKTLHFLTLLFAGVAFSSCYTSYNIEGSSDISDLDSRMIRLRTVKNDKMNELDSTEVVHGKFYFSGSTDSVRVAFLEINENFSLPVVLEEGDINVRINKQRVVWGGTELNDRLYRFMSSRDSLYGKLDDLEHEYTLAFMDGEDMQNDVIPRLSKARQGIMVSLDSLFTLSVTENFDNVIGPSIFLIATQMQQYPQMSPWVVEIMSKASDKFKNNPDVRRYIETAEKIQNQQNGLETPAPVPEETAETPQPPTPNDMAAPAAKKANDAPKAKVVEKADTAKTDA